MIALQPHRSKAEPPTDPVRISLMTFSPSSVNRNAEQIRNSNRAQWQFDHPEQKNQPDQEFVKGSVPDETSRGESAVVGGERDGFENGIPPTPIDEVCGRGLVAVAIGETLLRIPFPDLDQDATTSW